MKTSIIIPAYNTDWLLEKNLPVILKAYHNKKNNILEIIVVDDGSADNSYSLVKNKFPEVKIIKHKINRGFSSAVNTGARLAKGEYLCLLNSDVLPEENFLESVYPIFENSKVFAVSLNEVGVYSWTKGVFRNGFIEHETGAKSDGLHNTFWVSGGSGIFKRKIWMDIGGLDEKLLSPFYWEDIDICYRALKRGYKLFWDPDAKVVHKHETTMSLLPKIYVERIRERNQLLFVWKNLTSRPMFRKHIVGLLQRILHSPGYIRIVFMAVLRIGILAKSRRREIKESKISDETIFASFTPTPISNNKINNEYKDKKIGVGV